MPPIVIKRLSSNRTHGTQVFGASGDYQSFEDVLKNIYFDSEYIDPIEAIGNKIQSSDSEGLSIPFGAYLGTRSIAFFTIDFSNPPLDSQYDPSFSCWLDEFMVAQDCQGQGVAKTILSQLPDLMNKTFPHIRQLNLTVNFRNRRAKRLYRACGFEDTGDVYWGGPAGPQHILTKTI